MTWKLGWSLSSFSFHINENHTWLSSTYFPRSTLRSVTVSVISKGTKEIRFTDCTRRHWLLTNVSVKSYPKTSPDIVNIDLLHNSLDINTTRVVLSGYKLWGKSSDDFDTSSVCDVMSVCFIFSILTSVTCFSCPLYYWRDPASYAFVVTLLDEACVDSSLRRVERLISFDFKILSLKFLHFYLISTDHRTWS